MDQSFATCLAEIEKSYLVLPKAARIRVERWVEKLASTGNNPTWRKHRNEYAKLLLNMIIARNLEAPFNVSPPEGTLPPFTSQFKAYNRNLLGPHESAFWRGLYQQMQDESGKTFVTTDASEQDVTNSFRMHEESKYDFRRHESPTRFEPRTNGSTLQQPLTKEIHSLNILIREQSQKIKLLEQQLHDERTNHELQIQRLHYTNRVEVNELKSQLEQFAMELSYKDLEISKVQDRTYLDASLNTSLHAPHSPGLSVRVRSALNRSPAAAYSPHRHSPSATSRIPSTMNSGRRGLFSFLEQKNIISSPQGTGVMYDIAPSPPKNGQQRPQQPPQPQSQFQQTQYGTAEYGDVNARPAEEGYQEGESRFDSPGAKDLSLHWGSSNQQVHSAVGDLEDEAFLAHIDRFQSEIKKINTNVAATSTVNLF